MCVIVDSLMDPTDKTHHRDHIGWRPATSTHNTKFTRNHRQTTRSNPSQACRVAPGECPGRQGYSGQMSQVLLLDRLAAPTRQALLESGTTSAIPEGGFVVHDGEDARAVFFVLDGLLKVVKNSYDGRVSFMGLRRGGTVVGELALLTGATRSSSIQAVQPSHVIRVSGEQFDRLLTDHPDLSRALLTEIAKRLREATMQIHNLMNADARTRIAARLVQLADDTIDEAEDSLTLALPVSQEELGDWAGLSRAGAVKALRGLRDDQLIETSRMSISIRKLRELRLIATV